MTDTWWSMQERQQNDKDSLDYLAKAKDFVPPGMEQRMDAGRFNVIGDELRKIEQKIDAMDMVSETQGLQQDVIEQNIAQVQANQQLILQKLEGLEGLRSLILEVERRAAAAFRQGEQQITRRFDMQDKDLIALAKSAPKKRQPKRVRKVTKR